MVTMKTTTTTTKLQQYYNNDDDDDDDVLIDYAVDLWFLQYVFVGCNLYYSTLSIDGYSNMYDMLSLAIDYRLSLKSVLSVRHGNSRIFRYVSTLH